jgi:hypothetical protein
MSDRDTQGGTAGIGNVPESTAHAVDTAGLKSYMASIPITGIRRRIRARVGCACFQGYSKR